MLRLSIAAAVATIVGAEIAGAASSSDLGIDSGVMQRQEFFRSNTSSPPSRRSGPAAPPMQAGLPKTNSSDPETGLRLLCKVRHTEAVIKLTGIVSERRYYERDLVIEMRKHAATISVYGVSEDGRSQHYVEAKISEYQISAARAASKRGLTVVQGIVLNRLNGVVKITSERWQDAGEHVSFFNEYVGSCETAKNRRI